MRVRPPARRPVAMERVRQRFEQWRQTRTPRRSPIPDKLWTAAVALARQHGLYTTSRTLRLDYTALKKRVPAIGDGRVAPTSCPPFVELPPAPGPYPSCVIEIESPCGRRLRVQVPQITVPDLLALTRGMWSGAA